MSSLSLNLAFRYLRSNRGGVFSFTSFLAILGLIIGVSSLIIVMSVMNGFERELQNKILGVVPHAIIKSDTPIQEYESIVDQLNQSDSVISSAPYIELQGLISSDKSSRGVNIVGIDEVLESSISILPDNMFVGDIKDLQQDNSIIIGSWLASHLDINVGDSVSITTSDIKTTLLGSFPQSINCLLYTSDAADE